MKSNVHFILSSLLLLSFCLSPIQVQAQQWIHAGPYSAWVTTITVEQLDTSKVYAGTLARGIWKSTDSGQNWVEISNGIPVRTDSAFTPNQTSWWYGDYLPINTIVPHPVIPDNIWAGCDGGLLKSENGGEIWNLVDEGLPAEVGVQEIAILPDKPDTMFTGLDYPTGGLYKSYNGGDSWILVEDVPHGSPYYNIDCLEIDPVNSQHLFVGNYWQLLESWDYGESWDLLYDNITIKKLVIDPDNPLNLWALRYTNIMEFVLSYSTDGGYSWDYYPPIPYYWEWVSELYADAEWNLYVQHEEYVEKSIDHGETWDQIAMDLPTDGQSVRISSNPLQVNSVFTGMASGLYHSDNGGITNYHSENGIDNSDINVIVTHPIDSDIAYAGGSNITYAGDSGFWKTDDRGSNWNRLSTEDVNVIAIDPMHPDTLYIGGDSLKRSFDGGATWEDIRGQIYGSIKALAVHPTQTNIIFCGSLYRSEDYGNTWESIEVGSLYPSYGNLIEVDTENPNVVYIGANDLFKSEDIGLTWEQISSVYLKSLALVPGSERLYATKSGAEVLLSEDGGYNFESIGDSLSVIITRNVALNPSNSNHLLVTTESGVYCTQNDGYTWEHFDGPYNTRSYCMAFTADRQTLHIGTEWYGIWSVTDPFVGVKHNSPENRNCVDEFMLYPAYPNPFNATTEIRYILNRPSEVKLRIFDIAGREVYSLQEGLKPAGDYLHSWNAGDLASGIYLISIETKYGRLTQKAVLLK